MVASEIAYYALHTQYVHTSKKNNCFLGWAQLTHTGCLATAPEK